MPKLTKDLNEWKMISVSHVDPTLTPTSGRPKDMFGTMSKSPSNCVQKRRQVILRRNIIISSASTIKSDSNWFAKHTAKLQQKSVLAKR